MSYSLDGGASFSDYNFGATGVQTTTDILGAGSDGFYDIVILCKDTTYFKFFLTDGIQIGADSTPDLLPPTDVWSPKVLGDTAEFTNLATSSSLGAANKAHSWVATDASYGYSSPASYIRTFQDHAIWFRASCTKVAVFCRLGVYRLYRDGVAVGSVVSGGSSYNLVILSSSEDGAEHEYKIIQVGTSNNAMIYQIAVAGTYSATAPTLGRRVAFMGDSTTANTLSTSNSDQGHVSKLIGSTSLVCFNRGVSGNTTATMAARIAADTLVIPDLYSVVCVSGANDGTVADATLQTQMEGMYNAVLSDDANTLCHVVEAFPSSGNREGAVNILAVAAVANARCIYVDTDGWIISTSGVDTHDGQHPNDSGGTKIAAKFLEFLVSYGFRNMSLLGVG